MCFARFMFTFSLLTCMLFAQGLMALCEFIGGAHIYAECVTRGIGRLVWGSHPMQETNIGNFIYLQLGLAGKLDLGCEPKSMFVPKSSSPIVKLRLCGVTYSDV